MTIPVQIDFGRYIAGVVGSQEEADFVLGLMHYVAEIEDSFNSRFVATLTSDRWEIVLETTTPVTQQEIASLKHRLADIRAFLFGASCAYRKLKETG